MTISRRDFLLGIPALGLSAAAFPHKIVAAQLQEFNGPMADARDVYRLVKLEAKPNARPSMTPLQRDDLEHQIKCQCGCVLDVFTCRTTDFSCSVSPAMHSDVLALVEGGYNAPEILGAFQAVYGERVLMAPPRRGFNLLGYTLPFVAIAAGALLIPALLRRWKTSDLATPHGTTGPGRGTAESTDLATPRGTTGPEPETAGSSLVTATNEELARLHAAVRRDA